MAAFLNRALDLGLGTIFFYDTVGHNFYADVAALASADITRGCDPPDNTLFCPDDHVTRAQMAAFLHRALTGSGGGEGGDITDAAVSYFVASEGACIAHADRFGNSPPDPDRYDGVVALQTLDSGRVL
ncbi:MAG: S-layer homology domain-containing protein, partial [Actinomycetota bacterium]